MLKTRILTALVALPLAIAAIVWLPTGGLVTAVAALMLVGAWEWAAMMGGDRGQRALFVVLVALVIGVIWALAGPVFANGGGALIIGAACVFWVGVVALLARFPTAWTATLGQPGWAMIAGCVVLAAPVAALGYIHHQDQGAWLILVLCFMIWGADTGAYIAGKTLGQRKLIPAVSPGKTLEGAYGGIAAAMAFGAVGAFVLDLSALRILGFTVMGAAIALVSIVGDLTISMFKRSAGLKDSGAFFPGHGGVLDRLDSLIAAAPWFVVGLWLLA